MSQRVRGVVARSKVAPVTVKTIVVPDPGPGEALVRIAACGVCHTDLHYREGAINDQFPFLLGHEAAGTVEAVGEGVGDVASGDYVVLNWRAVCGTCRACRRGEPCVENMSELVCGQCGDHAALFGAGGREQLAGELGVPLLGRIPLDVALREAGDRGPRLSQARRKALRRWL